MAAASPRLESIERRPLAGRRVLVVDEDKSAGLMMRLIAEKHGAADVEVASDLDEALDTLGNSSRRFDLILLAFGACNMSGMDLMPILRAHRADIVVIAYGSPASHPVHFAGYAPSLAGCAAVIGMPCHLADLIAAADRALVDGWTIRRVVEDRTVPPLLTEEQAAAIHGALPGGRFYAPLDP